MIKQTVTACVKRGSPVSRLEPSGYAPSRMQRLHPADVVRTVLNGEAACVYDASHIDGLLAVQRTEAGST